LLERGQLTEPLFNELRRVTRSLLRAVPLPVSLSPYGRWDDSVADDLLHDWAEKRLLRRGTLLALLDKAWSPAAFRRLAQASLYQYVLSARSRSQSQNIYSRLLTVLEQDDRFRIARDAARRADQYFTLSETPAVGLFDENERLLSAAAFAAGDLAVLRYSPEAKRLSPAIASGELARFAASVMTHLDAGMTPPQIMRALAVRMDLETGHEVTVEPGTIETAREQTIADRVALRQAALSALAGMTSRQAEILARTARGETGQSIAEQLKISPATVHYEQRRVAALIDQFADNDDERIAVIEVLAGLLNRD
jgi:DNA-binding CsgD family transcriptional regulator